jgi:glutamate racemase
VPRNEPPPPSPVLQDQLHVFRDGEAIGLFDSGVGGLSVLRAVATELPEYDLVYFADSKYCPYGPRPPQEIRALSGRIVEFLVTQNCRLIVVACNTASAAALYYLRETFPKIEFVGMEPAVKPAASSTRSGKIAVLATRGTLEGELFANTRDEFARDVQVTTVYPPDWVERVERGDIASGETFESVRRVIEPLLDAGVDEIALGCTHYPFLAPLIDRVAQGRATILDPSDAVAKQTARRVHELGLNISAPAACTFYTSGDADTFGRMLQTLLHVDSPRTFQHM